MIIERPARAPIAAVAVLGALYVAAGGYVHGREWLDGYRSVPMEIPGWWVVRVGFPLQAATSALVALALIAVAIWFPRRLGLVAIAAIGLEVSSIAAAVLTRTGSLFGWHEPGWTGGPAQSVALQAAAALLLALAAQRKIFERPRQESNLRPIA